MAEPAQSQEDQNVISLEVAARLLMIGPERVRQLIKADYIVRVKPGYTTLVSAVQGYIRFLKDEDRKNTKTAAASRATEARTREIEMRIAERSRALIPMEDAQAVVMQLATIVRAELAGLPARYTRDKEERRRIENEITGSLDRIRAASEEAGASLATGNIASDA